ncbi:MAG: hypothetical protein UU16_C0017G0010 [Candidatus Woesebacteria bacterium GW2011_GWA2_40_7]|uniref:N-acetyltransferase domain-containing protein n=3 Tax=Candidatus Woeseibacteriota TaxID=1752722 RepID=A0A0G0UVB7_9BACT|nr:MAG: hypothetical protein UT17_C0002G0041 [Candidatus Woesebacteria bacterium GW2011_GWB1_39_10]KKR73634.1 MAG: hypothetical protein UU16_C0017G0010 [Candidatus Woesebacteria bacterium GW2011_GWA2_40_7]KKR92608.1 MAG: hypothetical protein UU42_C0001G0212 [Candidatus Woesebacteria bacterium GW2011_GWA1_41_13b]
MINMNKEILREQLINLETRNAGMKILNPGDLTSEKTADNVIKLLKAMYVEHGITKDKKKLVKDIEVGNVLSWFAQKDENFVATASLVKQDDGAWELGRAVSLDRGNGLGKRVILEALKFHLKNHSNEALIAEVRAADEFKQVPSGLATQKIFFGTINSILPITPFAIAPLFAHGDPLRNEQFILSASDIKPGKTISEKISDSINNRSTKGTIPRLQVIQTAPFRLAIPNDNGKKASQVASESVDFKGCSLFPVEVTDRNMPLIGMLSSRSDMVLCGVDRLLGNEGKPVVLIATLGFHGNILTGQSSELAPTEVSEVLPTEMRKDTQAIADKFSHIREAQLNEFRDGLHPYFRTDIIKLSL